jgi:hypothetical protein
LGFGWVGGEEELAVGGFKTRQTILHLASFLGQIPHTLTKHFLYDLFLSLMIGVGSAFSLF